MSLFVAVMVCVFASDVASANEEAMSAARSVGAARATAQPQKARPGAVDRIRGRGKTVKSGRRSGRSSAASINGSATRQQTTPAMPSMHKTRPVSVDAAQQSPSVRAPETQPGADRPPESPRPSDAELAAIAKTYCSNNTANVTEARLARQRRSLSELEREIDEKSLVLAGLVAEARSWTEKREKLLSAARGALVETFSKMRPEAAAQQLGAMNEEAAVSIIMMLNPRAASAIMNEMGSERAARLADSALRKGDPQANLRKSGS